jgi:transposase InsO family protein
VHNRQQASLPVATNLLDQNFVDRPNQIWLADITYIPTSEGWLYLAVILDLFTRKVVGWAMRDHMRAELTIAALTMAIQRQRPGAGLIHHSDRGSQGGINWSSQHNREECCDGRETAVGSSVTGQVEVARAAGDGAT